MKSGYALLTQDVYDSYTANFATTLGMRGQLVQVNSSSDVTVTISDILEIGDKIEFIQMGTGQVIFTSVSGVTIITPDELFTRAQYTTATIQKILDTEWSLSFSLSNIFGNITINGTANIGGITKVGAHGTASDAEVVNTLYGTTSAPPVTASTVPEGTIYIQYTA